jgi:hypothetical protein
MTWQCRLTRWRRGEAEPAIWPILQPRPGRLRDRDIRLQILRQAVPFQVLRLLYEIHTLLANLQRSEFCRKMMAAPGEASINSVPAFGLPKINSSVGGIFSPIFPASPL